MVFKNKILYCLLLGGYKFCAIEKFSKMENFSIEYMFLMYEKTVDIQRFFLPLFGIY